MDELKHMQKILNKSVAYTSKKDWIYDELSEKDLEYELELEQKNMENEQEQFERTLCTKDYEKQILGDVHIMEIMQKFYSENKTQKEIMRFKQNRENTFILQHCGDVVEKIYLCVSMNEELENILNTKIHIECNGCILFNNSIKQLVLYQMFYGDYIREDEEKREYQILLLNFTTMANDKNFIKGFPISNLVWCNILLELTPPENVKLQPTESLVEYYFLTSTLRTYAMMQNLNYLFPKNSQIYKTKMEGNEICLNDMFCISKFLLITFDKTEFPPLITYASFEDSLDIIEWEEEEILTVDIFETTCFILPLCREFKSWDSILTTFKDPENKLLDGVLYSNKDHGKGVLTIITDIEINAHISVYDYGFKSLRVRDGCCNFSYC